MKLLKKMVCVLLCLLLSGTFLSCNQNDSVMTLGTIQISQSMYTYWLSVAAKDWKQISEEEHTAETEDYQTWITERAFDYCLTYAAVLDQFNQMGLVLDISQKNAVSENIGLNWSYYSGFFKEIGVKKTDYAKVFEFNEYQDSIFQALYQGDGETAVSEEEIKSFFSENYILFRSIVGYRTDVDENGNSVSLSEAQLAEQTAAFYGMAAKVNDGVMSFDQANYQYMEDPTLTDEEAAAKELTNAQMLTGNIIHKTNTSYPDGFFSQVQQLEYNTANVSEFDAYIYLVQRLNELEEDTDYYETYREQCLRDMRQEDFNQRCEEWKTALSVVKNQKSINHIDIDAILSSMSK